jgi:UPF0271 protein
VRIDLNSDVGESFGPWVMGADAELIPLVTSVNIACGAHAGDPVTMERTVRIAVDRGVAIGAHPGYPDLAGFGRRRLDMSDEELEASLVFQIAALDGFARAAGVELRHIKPHGALYTTAATDRRVADAVARAVARVAPRVILIGLAGSLSLEAGRACGLRVAAEAFADRSYEADGTLRSRRLDGALIADPRLAAEQAVAIARDRRVRTHDGHDIGVVAETICLHGDADGVVPRARAVRAALEGAGVDIAPLAG